MPAMNNKKMNATLQEIGILLDKVRTVKNGRVSLKPGAASKIKKVWRVGK